MFPDHDPFMYTHGSESLKHLKTLKSIPSVISDDIFVHEIIKGKVYDQYVTSRFEAFMSSTYQSKLITSKASDKMIIDTISKNTTGTTTAPIFEMPFMGNIDTETILKLREAEHHAFNDYRLALDKAIKLYSTDQKLSDAKEIYDDIIYPAFTKLDAMFDRAKNMRVFKAFGELAIISSTVTLGIMNGIVPANPLGIVAALGGTGVLVNQITGIIERKLHSDNELESKDFYFLWKLKNKKIVDHTDSNDDR